MITSFVRRQLAASAVAAGLVLALAGCGGSNDNAAEESAQAAPSTATPTIGGTTAETETPISGNAQFVELGARARVAYDCAEADPIVADMAEFSGLGSLGADDPDDPGPSGDYDDGMSRDADYIWVWGGHFLGGDPEPAELDVSLFATTEDAEAWAIENTDSEDIRYGRTVIRYYGLDEHGDYGEYDAEPLDTTAFTNSLHRCFDLAGGFD